MLQTRLPYQVMFLLSGFDYVEENQHKQARKKRTKKGNSILTKNEIKDVRRDFAQHRTAPELVIQGSGWLIAPYFNKSQTLHAWF